MNLNIKDPLILGISYLLNIEVWFSHFGLWLKIILVIMTGLTTIMAFMNTYKTWKRNFKTLWIVVVVTHVITRLKPNKIRHRGIRIIKTKQKQDDTPIC